MKWHRQNRRNVATSGGLDQIVSLNAAPMS
jgi:hypothetical protein